MSPLPFELLSLIFRFLEKQDLLRCQLTSKLWYEASVELLYSIVMIDSGRKGRLYGRTISTSVRLGGYLKEIELANLSFDSIRKEPGVEETHLLETVTRNCPNLLRLKSDVQDYSFWYQVTYAVSRGQLTQLESIPFPEHGNLSGYNFAASLFKSTLTKLALFYNFDNPLLNMDYKATEQQTLFNKLRDFQNLQSISIHNESANQIGCFDNLIEDCPHLKEIFFSLTFTGKYPVKIDPETVIRQRPDIHTLECYWELINNASQLRYIMKKFPGLQHLIVTHHSSREIKESITSKCPQNTLVDFIRYAAAVPTLKIDLELNMLNLASAWVDLVRTKGGHKKVIIDYKQSWNLSDIMRLHVDTSKLILDFPVTENDTELPHMKFISEAGNMIRTLYIGNPASYSRYKQRTFPLYDQFSNIEWVLHILKSCPSLEEIRLSLRDDIILPSKISYRHTGLKRLSFHGVQVATDNTDLFRFISLTFPNIRQLHLGCSWNKAFISVPIVIDLSHSSLDKLSWENESLFIVNDNSLEACFKLTTDLGTRFYIGDGKSILSTTEEQYRQSLKILRFDITCRSLSEFRISKKQNTWLGLVGSFKVYFFK